MEKGGEIAMRSRVFPALRYAQRVSFASIGYCAEQWQPKQRVEVVLEKGVLTGGAGILSPLIRPPLAQRQLETKHAPRTFLGDVVVVLVVIVVVMTVMVVTGGETAFLKTKAGCR